MTGKGTSDSKERQLIDAARAHPDDDRPRLDYAAWLRAHERPLGDLIVAQCAGWQREQITPWLACETPHEARLLAQQIEAWQATSGIAGTPRFVRGFVEAITFGDEHALFDALPRLEAASPLLATIALDALSAEGARALARTPLPLLVDAIELHGDGIAPDALAALDQAVWLDSLVRLDLAATLSGEDLVARLAARRLPRLRALGLRGCDLTAAAIDAIVRAPWGARLEELDLADNHIVGAARHLASLVRLCRLRALDLSHNPLGRPGLAAIVALENWPMLRQLRLADIGARRPARELDAAPLLAELDLCDLSGNTIGDEGAAALASILPGMRAVYLARNDIGDAGALAIARALDDKASRDAGHVAGHAAAGHAAGHAAGQRPGSPPRPGLDVLDLGANALTSAGARALAEAPGLAHVARLVLTGNDQVARGTLDDLRWRMGGRLRFDSRDQPAPMVFQRGPDGVPVDAVLLYHDSDAPPRTVPITSARFVVGRSAPSDLVIRSDRLSRQHFILHFTSDGTFVEDTRSSSGTRVNGELVATARLFVGDAIEAGCVFFRLAWTARR